MTLVVAFVCGGLSAAAQGLSSPITSNLGANQVTLTLQSSATGTGYFTLLTDGETAGSAAQTAAGQNSVSATAFRHGSLPLTATIDGTYTVHNLTENTHYTVCFTADNGSTLAADVDASVSFTTTASTNLTGPVWNLVGMPDTSSSVSGYFHMALAPDGTPYVGYDDFATEKATVLRFNGTAWVIVGPAPFSAGMIYDLSMAFAPDGTPYVAYQDVANDFKTTVMKFNGTAWVPVGPAGFSPDQASSTSLAFAPDGSPYVAFVGPFMGSGGAETVMKFNGSNWVLVGTAGFAGAISTNLAFGPDGAPYVVFSDGAEFGAATAMKFNGSNWVLVGTPGFSIVEATDLSLAFAPNGTPYVCYTDDNARVMKFNGSDWEKIGSGNISVEDSKYPAMAFAPDGALYVSYQDGVNHNKATVRKFPSGGTDWETVGVTGFSADAVYATNLAMAPDGVPYVAFQRLGQRATVMKLAQSVSAYTVTSNKIYGPGGLNDALNLTVSGGTITFAPSFSGETYTPDDFYLPCILALTKDVIIDGSTLAQHVKLSGFDRFPVVIVEPGVTATLIDLDIVHGKAFIDGGGCGGGIMNLGSTLTLRNCTLADNTVTSGGGGGAFWNWGGTMLLQNCTLARNTAAAGGGFMNDGGSLTLQNCTLSGNQATSGDPDMGGGAIYQISGDTVLDHCTIVGNTAASPHEASSGLWILDGTLTLKNSIVANNGAGGTDNFSVTLSNYFISQGYNLSNDWNSLPPSIGDLTANPLLGTLTDNGGKTQTCALSIGSPAVNAADPADLITTDQRGIARPQDGRSDIGAYEIVVGVTSVDVPSGGTYSSGQALDFTVHFGSAVTVDVTSGTPRIALDIGGITRYADYFSGSGTTSLVFRYIVQPSDTDNDGIAFGGSVDLHGGTILTTSGGNSIGLTLSGVGSTAGIDVGTAPGIATDPTPQTVTTGATATFTVSASGSPAPTYQWQRNPLGSGSWSDLVIGATYGGVTTTSLTVATTSAMNTDQFRCVATNSISAVTSAAAILKVNKIDQTITFAALGAKTFGDAAFDVSASADSGLAVTFSIVSGPASLNGNTVTPTGAGAVTIRASQAGTTNVNTAANVDRSFSVAKATATITLNGLSLTYSGSSIAATATTTPLGLTVGLTYNGSATAPTNAGTYDVGATIADANYTGSASGALMIAKADQSVAFNPPATLTMNAPVTLTATASSGLPVTFSVVSGSATLSVSTLTPTAVGNLVLRAAQAGDSNHNAASLDRTLTVGQLSQTITFAPLADHAASDAAFALSATASSGLPVTLVVDNGPAMLSGSLVTLTSAPGSVTIRASQAGNAIYAAADDVIQSFTVTPIAPQVFFGETDHQDTIAANIATDNSHGAIIGYLNGSNQGFVVEFTLQSDRTFQGLASVFTGRQSSVQSTTSHNPKARSVTLTFTGSVVNGALSGMIEETGLAFTAEVQPQNGPTAAIAGYYTAPATDTATGSTYSVIGTTGRVYTLAVTPDVVTAGIGNTDSGGSFVVVTSGTTIISGQVNPSTTAISSTLDVGGVTVDFNGAKTTTPRTDRLINLSTRGAVSPAQPLIGGFVISGPAPKRVLLRAVGPGLTGFGVTGALSDPKLRLFNQQRQVILENDNWAGVDIVQTSQQVGAFALAAQSKDAAIIVTLPPGIYTMHVVSNDGSSGVALAEVYDASNTPTTEYERLVNISSRAMVGAGDNILIGGFVVAGNSPKRLLIRGAGPTLAQLGVSLVLADPQIRLLDSTGTLVARNDDWGTPVVVTPGQTSATAADLAVAATTTGAFPLDAASKDAALIVTLNPGIYTVLLDSSTNVPGNALIEIYEVP